MLGVVLSDERVEIDEDIFSPARDVIGRERVFLNVNHIEDENRIEHLQRLIAEYGRAREMVSDGKDVCVKTTSVFWRQRQLRFSILHQWIERGANQLAESSCLVSGLFVYEQNT